MTNNNSTYILGIILFFIMDVIYDTPPISIVSSRDGLLYRVGVKRLPSETEVEDFLNVLYTRVYTSKDFVLVYNLGDLVVGAGDFDVCYQRGVSLASFYNGVDMQESRLRAREVVIITGNHLLKTVLNMILMIYPSPVKITCRESF